MRFPALALALLSIPALLSAEGAPAAKPEVIALKAARLFDGRGDAALPNGVVIVEAGKIRAAGSGLAIPAGARVIDLGDATLLPGLIDAHTHLTNESTDEWLQGFFNNLSRDVAETAIRSTANARKTLEAGFTTVRDVGSGDYIDVGLRNTIRDGVVPGPRMLVAVHALGARGGHCDERGLPVSTASGLSRGSSAASPAARTSSATPCASRSSTAPTSSRSAPPAACSPCRRGGHLPALAGGDERHRRRGPPPAQEGGRPRPRRRGREVRHPRRHRLDRARLVHGRRGAADDEGARHVSRPHPARRRVRGRPQRDPPLSAGDRGQGQGGGRRPLRHVQRTRCGPG